MSRMSRADRTTGARTRRPQSRAKTLTNAALIAVLALTGAGTWWYLHPASAQAGTTATVRTATATVAAVSSTISAQGNIAAAATSSPAFAVSGTVATVATVDVKVGDVVTVGQRLGTLDTGPLDDAVTQAQAKVTSAKQQVTTASLQLTAAKQSLADAQTALATTTTSPTGTTTTKGTESQVMSAKAQVSSATSQVATAAAAVTQAKSDLATAQGDVAKAVLTAPIAGTVTAVGATVGSTVGNGSSGSSGSSTASASSTVSSGFATIADLTVLTTSASFAEADAAHLSVGQVAAVTFPAVPDASATAKVTSISPTGTTTNGVVTYAATVTLDAAPAGVRLGQTADVTVTTAEVTDAVTLPSNAVTVGMVAADGTTSGTVRIVAADGTTTATAVTIGLQGDSTTQIVSGVAAGDKVVVSLDTAVGTTTTNQQLRGSFGGAGAFPGGGFTGSRNGG
jgi:macrolide-specific efflux system membrane fusion protein